MAPLEVKAFAEKWFTDCTARKASEFVAEVERRAHVDKNWFADTTESKTNFSNGVLNTKTSVFTEGHSSDNGFKYVMPYPYDPAAKAPTFEKVLDDFTCGDKELAQQLLEFCGYCLSNDRCWDHKSLLLVGSRGSNGKSTFT